MARVERRGKRDSNGYAKFAAIAAILIWFVYTSIVSTTITMTKLSGPSNSDAPYRRGQNNDNGASSATSTSLKDFSLAKEQSFGFFNDVTTEQWTRLQYYHAALFPNYYRDLNSYSNGPDDKGSIPKLKNAKMWYGQNFQVEFICPGARRLPSDSMADGPKWICNPHRIAQQKDCLIYSVGSNGKTEFEKAVKEEIGDHCEIHTFDPVSYNKRNGNFKDALKPYSTFHNWGFGTPEQAKSNPLLKTLKQSMEELGHTGRTIDVFKIDCEWCEWFTWQEWLTVDMRQILVETHNAPMPNAGDMFFHLHDEGYVIFSKEANYENGAGGVEYAFVKLTTDFFLNDTVYSKLKQ